MHTFHFSSLFLDAGSLGKTTEGLWDPGFVSCVYLISYDDETPIYIGQTNRNVVEALMAHLGLFRHKAVSFLGEFILANWPQSLDLNVQVWSPNEIREQFQPDEWEGFFTVDLDTAKQYLIRRLNPCLNADGRRAPPRPLPAGWLRDRAANPESR